MSGAARPQTGGGSALRSVMLFAIMAALLVAVGLGQSWNLSLAILNLCLISAICSAAYI